MVHTYFECYHAQKCQFSWLQWWPDEILRQKCFLLCINNHWKYENKQYTIEKPYQIATRNAKKFFKFFKICWFLGPFFEKAVVLENGQIWNQSIFLNETFRRASSLRFIKNGCIVDGLIPALMPAMPIFPKHCFFKKRP